MVAISVATIKILGLGSQNEVSISGHSSTCQLNPMTELRPDIKRVRVTVRLSNHWLLVKHPAYEHN